MMAILWLFLTGLLGWRLLEPAFQSSLQLPETPAWLARLAASLVTGLLTGSWLTYLLAYAFARLLPDGHHPLLYANTLYLVAATVWFAWSRIRFRNTRKTPIWPGLLRSLKTRPGLLYLGMLLVWAGLGCWLMVTTFSRTNNYLHAGVTVFSDFAPHTAVTASFSSGRNWPSHYPHFGADGMRYHFMFFFLCGNLHYLGLPMDWAINLPSLLTWLAFVVLLAAFAVQLTGRENAFWLAPILFFFRSSLAIWTHLSQELTASTGPRDLLSLVGSLLRQDRFIGSTLHDDWGLWGVNVFANQRHFLSGLALALTVLFLLMPDVEQGLAQGGLASLRRRDGWLVADPAARKRLSVALLIVLLLPYWHGSACIWLLLVLFPLALVASRRLAFLALALTAVASSLLQIRFFAGPSGATVRPALHIGFLAASPTVTGMALYLLAVTGLVFPLLLVSFFLQDRSRRLFLLALSLPLVFTFTVSLTPDVTVNHKYLIASLALYQAFVADLLLRLWDSKKTWIGRLAACCLAFVLTLTGLEEWVIMRNANQHTVSIHQADPLVAWIKANTHPDDLFVTAPYHFHAFFLSGRQVFLGHAYYPWSAGHDTAGRLRVEQTLLSGSGGDQLALRRLVDDNQLAYLLLDDTLRQHPDFTVDEAFLDATFPLVARFSDRQHSKLYDLRNPVSKNP